MFACQAKCRRFESDYPLHHKREKVMKLPINEPVNTYWSLKIHKYPPWAWMSNVFTDYECDAIIELMKDVPTKEASTLNRIESDNSIMFDVNSSIRKNRLSWVPAGFKETDWIFRKLTDQVHSINNQFWNFDLDYIESLQYTIYDQVDDHYVAHEDFRGHGVHYRKLSFSIQLTDPNDYEGCNLMIHESGDQFGLTKRERGTMVAFPSFGLHKVTPLISGTRISLVGWVCGSPFK